MLLLRLLMELPMSLELLRRLVTWRFSGSKQTLDDVWTFWAFGGVDAGVAVAGVCRPESGSYSQPCEPISNSGSDEALEPPRGSRGLRWLNSVNTVHFGSFKLETRGFLSSGNSSVVVGIQRCHPPTCQQVASMMKWQAISIPRGCW